MSAIQRMINEMKRRGYAPKTIQEYSGSLRRMATYFGCCPSKLTLEQIPRVSSSSCTTERYFYELLQRDRHSLTIPVSADARA